MKRTQPYIPKAGKLAQQIQQLHSFGLSNPDFSQQIASRYSSFQLGNFPLVSLTLLQPASNLNYFNVLQQNLLGTRQSKVFNVTQILKNEVINSLPSKIQLKFNLNFLGFWNRVVLRLLGGENNERLPKLHSELLTFSQSNSILVTKTSQTHSSRELKERQPWLNQNLFLFQSPGNFSAIPLSVQSQEFGEYWRSHLVTRLFTKVRGERKNERESQPQHKFDPKQDRGLSDLDNRFTDTSLSLNTQPINDVVGYSVSKIFRQSNQQIFSRWLKGENNERLPKSHSELLTFSQSNSILVTKTSQTHSSRELKERQPWLNQNLFLFQSPGNFPAIPLSFRSQEFGEYWRPQLVTRLFTTVRGKGQDSREIQPKHNFDPQQDRGLSDLSKSFTDTKVGSEIELDRVNKGIEEYYEPVNLISRQTPREAVNLPQENKEQIWRSNFSTRLKQTQTSVLIHSRNMRRIISTFERKFNLIQQQQNIETTSILQTSKKTLNYHDELSLAPHHLRTKGINQQRHLLKESFPTSEELIFQQQVDRTAAKNQSPRDSAFSPATTMEFAQSQVIAKPISSHQESQIDRKNDWEKQKQANFELADIDINQLTDRVYQAIERKIKIERQRRGLV